MQTILSSIETNRQNLGKLVLVTGDFNILHPGHIRLLRFAKECGNTLVVGVNADELLTQTDYNDATHRSDIVASLAFVDYCFINYDSATTLIEKLKPHVVVKGKEYEDKLNPEQKAIETFGGKLIFSSGYTHVKSSSVFNRQTEQPVLNVSKLSNYMSRHHINRADIEQVMANFSKLNILVIGDTIIDEYMQCNAVGMSQEDPTIVVTPDEKKLFLGGAGITSAHAKGLGAKNVSFYTVLGEDKAAIYGYEKMREYQLKARTFVDDTRPTTKKRRYRVGNKTLLRVNDFREHDIGIDIQEAIMTQLAEEISQTDLVIFSDFNYGILPQPLVDGIIGLCHKHHVMVAADSQTSSQVGDISRFKNVDLITPTEREIRVALNNTRDGLVVLADKLHQKMQCPNIIVTLADEGALLHRTEKSEVHHWNNDKIPALASNPIDPAGAGDCMLAATAMALVSGGDLWLSALIGSVAAACQVSRVGNTPLEFKELMQALEQLT
ncbi:PfkB family carbohydrate kinase [Pseudocolwellia agarivorans]|uniref:PfkB family carbohydrate kinase n=1 Tax=Pseudocolwellia agarivorans TaxID=1911682 RepID=UPI0009863774|nr:PfkB family carbohydrate kinase [Pseudocolwellia agarivorans]